MHLGRGLPSAFSGTADNVAVLDYRFWESHLGADAGVLGQRLEIGGAAFTIIGVAAPDFRGVHRGAGADVWFPLEAFATSVWNARSDVIAERFRMVSVGRLASGRSVGDAENELRELTEGLRGEFRDDLLGLRLIPFEHLAPNPRRHADAVRQIRWLAAVAVLLGVVAASNLSLFLMARGARREREIAIRVSIGATPGRLVRQLLTESSSLVLAGAALGLVGHVWLTEIVRGLSLLADIQWREAPTVDGPMVAFVAVLTLARLSAPDRVRTAMSGVAAFLTALMSALGLFGALRLALESARFELALRSALGAERPYHARRRPSLRRSCDVYALFRHPHCTLRWGEILATRSRPAALIDRPCITITSSNSAAIVTPDARAHRALAKNPGEAERAVAELQAAAEGGSDRLRFVTSQGGKLSAATNVQFSTGVDAAD